MKSANILRIWFSILPLLFLATNVLGNELDSTNFKMIGVTTTGGGGIVESTSYKMLSTVGQISSDPRIYSTNYRLDQDPSAIFRAAQPTIHCFETTTDGYSECVSGPQDLTDGGMVALCGAGGCYDKARFEIGHTPYLYDTSLDGLIGYWPLDEPSGTGAYIKDRSGMNNHGTPTGTSFVDGISRGTRSFNGDGSGDVINAGTSTTLEPTTELTVSAWVYAKSGPASQGRTAVSKYRYVAEADQYGWNFGAVWTGIYFGISVCSGTCNWASDWSFFTNHLNQWVHLTGVYKGSEYLRLYKNGSLLTQNTTNIHSSIPYYSNDPFTIGRRSGNAQSYWDGYIDEVMVFDRALSASEIEDLYLRQNAIINPPDTLYGIEISTDNFVSDIKCIDGSTFRPKTLTNCDINDFRTEEYWENETFNIQGLQPDTKYYIRISALHGDFTQSDFSSVRDATTSEGYMFFDIDIATSSGYEAESSPPYSVTFSGSQALIAGAPAQTAPSLIWLDAESSSTGGIAIIQFGLNGGLYSPTTSETLTSTNQDLNTVDIEGFGLQSYYVNYLSSSYLGSITPTSNYSGSGNIVGEVSTTAKKIYEGDGPINEGRMGIYLKARAGSGRTPASDYSETISFIMIPRY